MSSDVIISRAKLTSIFVFISFFPFVSIIPLRNYSVQPFNITVLILLGFIIANNRFKKRDVFLTVTLLLLVLVASVISPSTRDTVAFSFLALNLLVLGRVQKYMKIINVSVLARTAMIFYLIVGIIQMTVRPDFFSFFIGTDTIVAGSGRGVSSMASEPSYYALSVSLIYLFSRKGKLDSLLLASNLVCSGNTLFLLLWALAISYYVICNFKGFQNMVLFALACLLIVVIIKLGYFSDSRVLKLMDLFLSKGFKVVEFDDSIADRLGHVIYSNLNWKFNGFNSWITGISEISEDTLFEFRALNTGRILSFTGNFLWNYGLLGFLWIVGFMRPFHLLKNGWRGLFLVLVSLQAVSVALPLLSLSFYWVIYEKNSFTSRSLT